MKVGFLWYDGRYTIETVEQHQTARDVGIGLIDRYNLAESEVTLAVDGRSLDSTENVATAVTSSGTLWVTVYLPIPPGTRGYLPVSDSSLPDASVPGASVPGASVPGSSPGPLSYPSFPGLAGSRPAASSTAPSNSEAIPAANGLRGALSISLVPGASLKIEPDYYDLDGSELRIDPKLAEEVSAGLRLVPRRPLDGLAEVGYQMWTQQGGLQDWMGQLGLLGIITGILATGSAAEGLKQWPYLRWILLLVLVTGTSMIATCVLLGYNFHLMPYLPLPKVYPEASRAEDLVPEVPMQRVARLEAGADADKILDIMRQPIGIWSNVALFFVSLVPPVYADWEAAVTARRAVCRDAVILAIDQYRPVIEPQSSEAELASSELATGVSSGVSSGVEIPSRHASSSGDVSDFDDSEAEFFVANSEDSQEEAGSEDFDSEAEYFAAGSGHSDDAEVD